MILCRSNQYYLFEFIIKIVQQKRGNVVPIIYTIINFNMDNDIINIEQIMLFDNVSYV